MNVQKKLREIFSKDSRTLKSINNNIKKGLSDENIIAAAYKARKSNKQLKALISELNYNIDDLLLKYPSKKRRVVAAVREEVKDNIREDVKKEIVSVKEETKLEVVAVKDKNYPGIEQLTEDDKHPKISKVLDEVDEKIIIEKDTTYEKENDSFLNKTINLFKAAFSKKSKKNNIDNSTINYTMNGNSQISLFINGDIKTITPEHQQFNKIKSALENKKFAEVRKLIDIKKKIEMFVGDNFKIVGDNLYYENKKLEGVLANKIIDLVLDEETENKTIYPFLKFLMKVSKNPDQEAVKDLYLFLQKGRIPITRSGNIITYKKIDKNWKDCYTGTIDNSIGSIIKMDRKDCDNNRNVTCSTGLHVANYSYMKNFGGNIVVLCEVNPKNVVSVPVDYNSAKMRCCEYKVIKEVTKEGEVLKNTILF